MIINIVVSTLLFLFECCLFQYWQHYLPNILLIWFAYQLHTTTSTKYVLPSFIYLELISFLKINIFGISSIIIISLLPTITYHKKLFYFPIFIPSIFIMLYQVLYTLCYTIVHKGHMNLLHLILQITSNIVTLIVCNFILNFLEKRQKNKSHNL